MTDDRKTPSDDETPASPVRDRPKETGGRKGPEPTRYNDWEKNGIASDF